MWMLLDVASLGVAETWVSNRLESMPRSPSKREAHECPCCARCISEHRACTAVLGARFPSNAIAFVHVQL
eukprot:CAMPEP_0181495088 /NCGR_PEP_ID=MMETSP1110-20121109/52182_1 /TAXON_ID=174948 /ORGANISM="Symbiodinium sp., Strain CCMP421" /LENGTH=69 /DNA_ID=CAMNT_0023622671 /DNA_START=25 /DNA_END=230 /DNA_ORIENTATION=-